MSTREAKAWSPSAAREAARSDLARAIRRDEEWDMSHKAEWVEHALEYLLNLGDEWDAPKTLGHAMGDIDTDDAPTLAAYLEGFP